MARKMMWLGLAALLPAAALVLPAAADGQKLTAEAKEDVKAAKEAGARAVEMLAQAYRLADIAQQEKLPEAYITAGSLVRKVKGMTDKAAKPDFQAQVEVSDKADKPVKEAKVKAQKAESLDGIADRFFDLADELGAQLKQTREVKALIESAKERKEDKKTRGRVGGAFWQTYNLPPNQWHVWNITYQRGPLAGLAVVSQNSLPFRCRMEYMVNGKTQRVYLDNPSATHCYQSWGPDPTTEPKTYVITVRVFNPNAVNITYLLSSN